MKHIRFFQEFSDKRRTVATGNVVAALTGNGAFVSGGTAQYEAIVGLFAEPNSPVCGGSVAIDYLRSRCKRVSEAVARRVHPALFLRLDRA